MSEFAGLDVKRSDRELRAYIASRVVVSQSGCHVWNACRDQKGYGFVAVGSRAGRCIQRRAHRVNFELSKGPVPAGLQLDHLCRNHSCVNPEHLEPVTSRENCMRGISFAAKYAAQTHCKNGHAFTAENSRVQATPKGVKRVCRVCENAYKRAWRRGELVDEQTIPTEDRQTSLLS
jgi:hypothetical protein